MATQENYSFCDTDNPTNIRIWQFRKTLSHSFHDTDDPTNIYGGIFWILQGTFVSQELVYPCSIINGQPMVVPAVHQVYLVAG